MTHEFKSIASIFQNFIFVGVSLFHKQVAEETNVIIIICILCFMYFLIKNVG